MTRPEYYEYVGDPTTDCSHTLIGEQSVWNDINATIPACE